MKNGFWYLKWLFAWAWLNLVLIAVDGVQTLLPKDE